RVARTRHVLVDIDSSLYLRAPSCALPALPTRRSSDLTTSTFLAPRPPAVVDAGQRLGPRRRRRDSHEQSAARARPSPRPLLGPRSQEHTSELQSRFDLVCRLLLEKRNYTVVAPAVGRG